MKIPVFITVRTGSTRLPRKSLLPIGDGNVLEHIIKRARHLDYDTIIEIAGKLGVKEMVKFIEKPDFGGHHPDMDLAFDDVEKNLAKTNILVKDQSSILRPNMVF